MIPDDDLAHVVGYAAIAFVLASSTWAGPLGAAVGYTFGIFVAVELVVRVTGGSIHRAIERLRPEPPDREVEA